MRYLCLLVTPPGGIVLDPFMGSGTTGCGAVQEGFRFIGFDLEAEHVEIAKARIAYWTTHKHKIDTPLAKALDTRKDAVLF
jgi:site-specific DNA-methyltransferase (adenine-specific)